MAHVVPSIAIALAAAVGASPGAADAWPLQFGAAGGTGNNVNVASVQAAWVPPLEVAFLQRHDIEPRLIGGVAYWWVHDHPDGNRNLVDGSVLAALHWTVLPGADCAVFIEPAFGVELLSNVKINGRDLTTAFQFGSQLAAGVAFGPDHRWEIAAFVHHTSNGDIKLPNWGLTYAGVMLRVPLQ